MLRQTGKNVTKHFEIIAQLKYLKHFWRTLEMPLINCDISLCPVNLVKKLTNCR